MDIHSRSEWDGLGTELRKRRGQLGYGSRERKRFARDVGLNYRLVQRIETGEREGYPPETIAQVEDAYALERDAIGAFFTSGYLAPRASEAGRGPVRLTAEDEFERHVLAADLPYAEKAAAVRRHREQARAQLAELGLDENAIIVPDILRAGIDRITRGAADDGHGRAERRA